MLGLTWSSRKPTESNRRFVAALVFTDAEVDSPKDRGQSSGCQLETVR